MLRERDVPYHMEGLLNVNGDEAGMRETYGAMQGNDREAK